MIVQAFRPAVTRGVKFFRLADLPGARVRELALDSLPHGWFLTNPSICNDGSGFTLTAKTINYNTEDIISRSPQRWEAPDGGKMRVVNVLMQADRDLNITGSSWIDETWARLHPPLAGWTEDYRCFRIGSHTYVMGSGANDCRHHDGQVWHVKDMQYRTFVGRISLAGSLRVLRVFPSPSGADCDKNWIPCVSHRPQPALDLIVNPVTMARLQVRFTAPDALSRPHRSHPLRRRPYRWQRPWSGSSGGLRIGDRWAFILHQRIAEESLWYLHKLVLTDVHYCVLAESAEFVFEHQGIEFCGGLAEHHDGRSVCLAYGSRDKFSKVLILPIAELLSLASPR